MTAAGQLGPGTLATSCASRLGDKARQWPRGSVALSWPQDGAMRMHARIRRLDEAAAALQA